MFFENFRAGKYEVAAIDYVALSADASSVLAPFAQGYTGGAAARDGSLDFDAPIHTTGYHNATYVEKMNQAFATSDAATRANLLHEAEKILIDDATIIPIVFNQNATLTSKDFTDVKYSYYGTPIFTKAKLKDYLDKILEKDKAE